MDSYTPGCRFDPDLAGRLKKPARGSHVLERERIAAKAKAHEIEVKKAVKARDGKCRWPETHKCRGGLEAAHIHDASLGGPMESYNLVVLCAWIHRRGPESVHGKQLQVYMDTMDGADGPLSFWKQADDGSYYMVKRETSPFVYEKD